MKVLVLGLDGAPFRLWDELCREMSTLRKLKDEGAYGILESTIPSLSLLAWPVFYTGKNPGKIGIFVTKLEKETLSDVKLPTSRDVKSEAFWDVLGDYGKKVGVVNIPVTYPAWKVNGFMITGFLTPFGAKDFTYPPSLKDEIPDYIIDLEILTEDKKLPDRDFDREKVLSRQYEITRKRKEVCLRLIKRYSPDFFVVNFKGVDNVQHIYWDVPEKIMEFFRFMDGIIKEFLEVCSPEYVFIMSDHGFHPRSTKYFYINRWLELNGYLRRKVSLKARISNLTYVVGIKVVEWFPFIRNLVPERAKRKVVVEGMRERIDWEHTLAYADWHRGIYINRSLPEERRRALVKEIVEKMREARDPETGEKIFQRILTKEEAFSGPYTDMLPDIIWLPSEGYRINANLYPSLTSPRLDAMHTTGEHMADPRGIWVMHGKNVKRERIDAKIQDLAPTILALMGVPVPEDMDGEIPDAFTQPLKVEYVKREKKEKGEFGYTEKEEEELEKRLKGLGYL